MLSLLLLLIIAPIEVDWEGYDYYRPITDNFLFRPLGWTKPDLTPRYELIGTIVGEDFARGYIINVRTNRIRIVEAGSELDTDNVVSEVSRNKVRMNNGKDYVAKSIRFLNIKKRGSRSRTTTTKTGNSKSTTSETVEKENTGVRQRTNRGSGRTGGGQWQEQIEQFQNASPEDRRRMIQEFRSRGGNRRRRSD